MISKIRHQYQCKLQKTYLDSKVGAQVEVESISGDNSSVNSGTWRNVLGLSNHVTWSLAEDAGVMALLDDNVGDGRVVVLRDHSTSGTDSIQLFTENLGKLSIGDSITVDNDAFGMTVSGSHEGHQAFTNSLSHVDNRLTTTTLNLDVGTIRLRHGVQVANNSSDRRHSNTLLGLGGMGDIDAENKDGTVNQVLGGDLVSDQARIDSTQLHVHLEDQVSTSGGRRTLGRLEQDTLTHQTILHVGELLDGH